MASLITNEFFFCGSGRVESVFRFGPEGSFPPGRGGDVYCSFRFTGRIVKGRAPRMNYVEDKSLAIISLLRVIQSCSG